MSNVLVQDGQYVTQNASAWTRPQQYQQHSVDHMAAPQCSDPPRSLRHAMCSNVGRPPRSLAVFGFGGRCCLFRLPPAAPGYSETYTPNSTNIISIMAFGALQQSLVKGADIAVAAEMGQGKRQTKSRPISAAVAELQDWPGPVSLNSPAPKALAAAVEKRATEAASRGQDALALLWRLLLVMAKHKGAVQDGMCKHGAPEGAILALVKRALEGSDAMQACNTEAQRLREWAALVPDAAAIAKVEALLMDGQRAAALTAATEAQVRSAVYMPCRKL